MNPQLQVGSGFLALTQRRYAPGAIRVFDHRTSPAAAAPRGAEQRTPGLGSVSCRVRRCRADKRILFRESSPRLVPPTWGRATRRDVRRRRQARRVPPSWRPPGPARGRCSPTNSVRGGASPRFRLHRARLSVSPGWRRPRDTYLRVSRQRCAWLFNGGQSFRRQPALFGAQRLQPAAVIQQRRTRLRNGFSPRQRRLCHRNTGGAGDVRFRGAPPHSL